MLYTFLLMPFLFILSACTVADDDLIPHNVIYFENDTIDTVTLMFKDSNRFTRAEWEQGVPIQLSNHSFLTLETDLNFKLEGFDEGWEELERVDNSERYSIERLEDIGYSVSASDFESSLEEGRYRLVVDYRLMNDGGEEEHSHTIGAVFWIQSEGNQLE